MANQSGVDALLDALKKSGMDVDASSFGGAAEQGKSSEPGAKTDASDTSREKAKGTSARGKRSGGFGDVLKGMAGAAGDHLSGSSDSEDGTRGPNIPHITFDVENTVSSWGIGRKVAVAILVLVILAAAYWWFHPPLNIQSPDTWFIIVVACVFVFLLLGGASVLEEHQDKKARKKAGVSKEASKKSTGGIKRKLLIIPVAVLVVGAIGWLLSQSFFPGNAAKYASILQTESLDFATDIEQVDYSEVPVIDRDAAEILGDKQMGTISEYVSQFEVDSLYSQINYNGSPVRVSPLNYADLFKWLTNREEGIPAYALVNMTTQETQIVRISDIDGAEGQGIKYSASEPLARNIDRYVQLKYPFYMFDEKSFEIDENGHPWWICPVQTKTIGLFGGTTITRAVMCDAVTGECQDLAVEDIPEWVDRVYPSELVLTQYNWYGAYNNGWLNSWLGQKSVVKTTPGTDGQLGYNYIAKDDDVWVYTGVTSATSDSSIVGFVLVNQRTAESHFYSIAGATESSAMESAEGQVQNLRYTATFPILINVSNQPTYFMALKDSAGTVKKFAMLDIQRYQNVAIGDTVAECQKSYEALLATNGVDLGPSGDLKTKTGVIARMAQAVIESNSHFYVKIEGDEAIYDFALPNMLDIVGYGVGDTITFTYIEGASTNSVQEIVGADKASTTSSTSSTGSTGSTTNTSSTNTTSASNTTSTTTNANSTNTGASA